jgi:hypothetical protein
LQVTWLRMAPFACSSTLAAPQQPQKRFAIVSCLFELLLRALPELAWFYCAISSRSVLRGPLADDDAPKRAANVVQRRCGRCSANAVRFYGRRYCDPVSLDVFWAESIAVISIPFRAATALWALVSGQEDGVGTVISSGLDTVLTLLRSRVSGAKPLVRGLDCSCVACVTFDLALTPLCYGCRH